ncbi:hypothetical protein BH23DEI1_BH23DEI1_03880 [soil metagenome]
MRPNALYQATVEELEAVLPPRVVSRALKEGLGEVDQTPASVAFGEVERILKGAVFKYLQVTNPAEQARTMVAGLLERLQVAAVEPTTKVPVVRAEESAVATVDVVTGVTDASHAAAPAAGAASASSVARLATLRAAMRPFNLYFGWPEVRKLRAQVQVLESEVATRDDLEAAFDEAEAQLRIVEQKLEDQLVLQARDLGELEEAFEAVANLGGPRVRRLEALVGQVRQAQAERTLADAECERGRTLARDLRKLMESSVYRPEDPPDTSLEGRRRRDDAPPAAAADFGAAAQFGAAADFAAAAASLPLGADEVVPEHLSAEVTERLLRLDLESETKELASLQAEHGELLRYLPDLATHFESIRGGLDGRTSVAGDLKSLRETLAETSAVQRNHLQHELDAVADEIPGLHPDVGVATLERAVRVTRDVLAEGLPAFDDVHVIRDLHRSARERSEELTRREEEVRSRTATQIATQVEVLERIDAALARPGFESDAFAPLRTELGDARDALAEAIEAGRADSDALERARRGESRWERGVAERADDARERVRARLRSCDVRLSALPQLGSVPARAADLRQEIARFADEDDLDEAHVAALGSLVDRLHADAVAEAAHRLDSLGKEAGESVGEVVLRELQAAARSLAADTFPDLDRLRLVIDQERASARERDQTRLQRLQLDGSRLDTSGVPSVERLRASLATARAELDEGRPATRHLDAAETAVVEIERQMRERLAAFEDRLDVALAALTTVERLNNDDVAAVRRILTHLDSQRDAIGRVSPGLQAQLVGALAEAETLLQGLEEAYEATRAVADQLVSGSMLDDVLGFFDDLSGGFGFDDAPAEEGVVHVPPDESAVPDEVTVPDEVVVSDERAPEGPIDPDLASRMDAYRELEGVDAVFAVDGGGRPLGGALAGAPTVDVAAAVSATASAFRQLGTIWEAGSADVIDLALPRHHLLMVPTRGGGHLALLVGDLDAVPALTTRLREEHDGETDSAPLG